MGKVIISGEWGGKEAGSPSPHFRSKTPSTEKVFAETRRGIVARISSFHAGTSLRS